MTNLFWHLGKASAGAAIFVSGVMKISLILALSNSIKADVAWWSPFVFLGICLFLNGVKGLNSLKA